MWLWIALGIFAAVIVFTLYCCIVVGARADMEHERR